MAYLMKALKQELITLAEDLGLQPDPQMNKAEICKLISSCKEYDEDFIREGFEFVRESTKERELKERELKEQEAREKEREFELQKLQIASSNSSRESSQIAEAIVKKRVPDLRKMMPEFNAEESEINTFCVCLNDRLEALK